MRSLALAVLSTLAACSTPRPGVALEVTADVPIDRVEVFVATSGCYEPPECAGKTTPECELMRDCEGGVAWASDITRPRGSIFFMIEDEQRIETTRVDNGRFVMHLQATPAAATPHVMAIVGFRGELAVAFQLLRYPYAHIPVDSAEIWRVHLAAADAASDDTTTEPSGSQRYLRVHAWERKRVEAPDELSRCLAVQSWDRFDQDWKSLFIVPVTDPDCDGQEPECNAGHADFNADGRELACVTTRPSERFGDICVLGGSRCADGANGGGCAYTPSTPSTPSTPMHCFPSDACGRCAGRDGDVATCLHAAIKEDRILHADCAVAIDSSGRACGLSGGTGAQLRIEMRGPCISSALRYAHAPLTSANPPLVAGQVRIYQTHTNLDGICYLELFWSGTATQGQVARFLAVLFTGTNYLYVPVRLEFAATPTGCDNTSVQTCEADPSLTSDSIVGCF